MENENVQEKIPPLFWVGLIFGAVCTILSVAAVFILPPDLAKNAMPMLLVIGVLLFVSSIAFAALNSRKT